MQAVLGPRGRFGHRRLPGWSPESCSLSLDVLAGGREGGRPIARVRAETAARLNLTENITLGLYHWGWVTEQRVERPGLYGGWGGAGLAASLHASFSKGPATTGVLLWPRSWSSRPMHACSVDSRCSVSVADRRSNPFPRQGGVYAGQPPPALVPPEAAAGAKGGEGPQEIS